jgi:predicted DNA-binding transcriptional regulator AlpA
MERVKLRDDLEAPTVEVPTFLNTTDIAELARVHTSTVSRWSRDGTFPRPVIVVGSKIRLWLASDYADWVKAFVAARDEASKKRMQRRVR